jgi:FtsH-binding integral membrane protein
MNPSLRVSDGAALDAPRRDRCRAFEILRVAAGYNFVVSCLVVPGWIGYGAYRRLPLDKECLGIRAQIGIPAWLDCAVAGFILLLVFLRRRDAVAWKLRLFFIGVGTCGFIWSVVLPLVFQDSALRDFFRDFHHMTFDTGVGWYAFASTVATGIIGPSDLGSRRAISGSQLSEK